MRAISIEGFEKPKAVSAGAVPMLQWLNIAELIVDPAYQRPIVGKGRRNVDRIARTFTWACFAPVVVAPVAGGKFAIIDGQHRTTAAALAGFDCVPCQIVIAAREEQAAAFKAINGVTTPISRMALHAAALMAGESWAIRLADVCARAEIELLRYPVPLDNQAAGQTMAVGAIDQCLKRHGEETLITALQCVTQTTNNRPGMLSARLIKALYAVLDADHHMRDSGLGLLEAFDTIDLAELQENAAVAAAVKTISRVQALAEQIRLEINRMPLRKNQSRWRGHPTVRELQKS
jgi:ParB-like nuclease domain